MIKSYGQENFEQDTGNPPSLDESPQTTHTSESTTQEDSEGSDKETEQVSDSETPKRRRIVLQRGYKLEGSSRKAKE